MTRSVASDVMWTATPGVARRAARLSGLLRLARSALFVLVALLWLAPGFWALVTSFKITPMILQPVPFWLPIPATLDQYVGVLSGTRSSAMTIAVWNSALVSVLTTLATVAACALTAYP